MGSKSFFIDITAILIRLLYAFQNQKTAISKGLWGLTQAWLTCLSYDKMLFMVKRIHHFLVVLVLLSIPFVADTLKPIDFAMKSLMSAYQPLLFSKNPHRRVPLINGWASWYSTKDKGVKTETANGERFDDSKATCASWDYPFGTYLKVTNSENGRSIICRVNDRGPNLKLNRAIDLTKSAFQKISVLDDGIIKVSVKRLYKS